MTNPDVDDWFERLDHPLSDLMLEVRAAILGADDRVTEGIKWNAPTFTYKGNVVSIQPNARKFVSLLFHQGGEIPGTHPELAGEAPVARIMRFADSEELERKRSGLSDVIRAWCDWKDG